MKRFLKVLTALAFLICIPAVHAAPKLTGLPLPHKVFDTLTLKVAQAPVTCPSGATHCVIATWIASSDGAANPTLGYNFYIWPAAAAAPVCTNGNPCTGVAPANSSPVASGCSGGSCTFTDVAVGPGKFNVSVTAILNGSESVLSNVIAIVIAPAAPVLSGSGS